MTTTMLTVLLALLLMTTLFTMTTTMAQQPPCGFDLRDLTACEPNKRRPPRGLAPIYLININILLGFLRVLTRCFHV